MNRSLVIYSRIVVIFLLLIAILQSGCNSGDQKSHAGKKFVPKNVAFWIQDITILSKEKNKWSIEIDGRHQWSFIWHVVNENPEITDLSVLYYDTREDKYGIKSRIDVATVHYRQRDIEDMRKYKDHLKYFDKIEFQSAWGWYSGCLEMGITPDEREVFYRAFGEDMDIEFHGNSDKSE